MPNTEMVKATICDAMLMVRYCHKNDVVAGGGAIEMELSKRLHDYAKKSNADVKPLIEAIANALEIIPRQLCDNAGFDTTNIVNALRQKHQSRGKCV